MNNNSDSATEIENSNGQNSLDVKVKQIYASLFWYAEPVEIKKLSKILEIKESEVEACLKLLEENLNKDSVFSLVRNGSEVTLTTSKEMAKTINKLVEEELVTDLGKAGMDTLSIILYKGPVSRSDIDYIRGVNSAHIVRNLLLRGLIVRSTLQNEKKNVYLPSTELLTHLGVTNISELPNFESIKNELESVINSAENSTNDLKENNINKQ